MALKRTFEIADITPQELADTFLCWDSEDLADEYASEADWRYQEARDRQLMERWAREP